MTILGHFPQNSAKTAKNPQNAEILHRIPHFADNFAGVGTLFFRDPSTGYSSYQLYL